jgi:hypothetical protein
LYQQDNWSNLLLLAEFAYNNAPNASTSVSPFFANKGYHPALDIHPEHDVASLHAQEFTSNINKLHDYLAECHAPCTFLTFPELFHFGFDRT